MSATTWSNDYAFTADKIQVLQERLQQLQIRILTRFIKPQEKMEL